VPAARGRGTERRAAWLLFGAALAAAPAMAQEQHLDAPYVPTPQVVVDEMLRLAGTGPRDHVFDLGSGDGRIVITAARTFGARATGVELDFHLAIQSEARARELGLEDRVSILEEDLFRVDLQDATVVTLYLVPRIMRKVKPRLLALRPGTRIVSHDFDFDDWRPDRQTTIRKNVFLWVVPAQVGGRWRVEPAAPIVSGRLELAVEQRYQVLAVRAWLDGEPTQVWEAQLTGERLSFVMVDGRDRDNEAGLYFEGRVRDGVIEGTVARGVGRTRTAGPWRAVRAGS
jgi:SAM-dependent methyltransferase